MRQTYEIGQSEAGQRLDIFLTAKFGVASKLSRSKVQALIKAGRATVNELKKTPHYALEEGDKIEADFPDAPTEEFGLKPRADIKFGIVHEDDDLIVVEKPSGLLVHPAVKTDTNSLANALVAYFPPIAEVGEAPERPGIVHRLDKDASGLLVVAKTQHAFDSLKAQFQEHSVKKEYAVLVDGGTPQDTGTITLSVGRKTGDGKMAARHEPKEGDREAVTHYSVDARYIRAALLTVRTETGRTHQIRVHMNAIGCPVVGDLFYGARRDGRVKSPRLFLHAKTLAFDHPVTGERVEFTSPLPPELQTVLDSVRD
jgi:23S rRNA pseudouridine1911/1915/1917 synthase